jgi:putative endonuclease
MFYVYILQSQKTKRYYTGSTEYLAERVREHNAGQSKSTRGGVPWIIVYSKEYETRAKAVRAEMEIKARGARRFLDGLAR